MHKSKSGICVWIGRALGHRGSHNTANAALWQCYCLFRAPWCFMSRPLLSSFHVEPLSIFLHTKHASSFTDFHVLHKHKSNLVIAISKFETKNSIKLRFFPMNQPAPFQKTPMYVVMMSPKSSFVVLLLTLANKHSLTSFVEIFWIVNDKKK